MTDAETAVCFIAGQIHDLRNVQGLEAEEMFGRLKLLLDRLDDAYVRLLDEYRAQP